MAERKNLGDESRGQDNDEGPGPGEKLVQDDTPYISALKARLGQQPKPRGGKVDHVPDEEPKNSGFVIYGDDGHPVK